MTFAPQLVTGESFGRRFLTDRQAASVGARIAFTDRIGGTSVAPWDTLNLSDSVGDDPSAVASNRAAAAEMVEVAASSLRFARQVHGADVLRCDGAEGVTVGEGDALLSTNPDLALTILTADCVPVLLAGRGVVAAVHAGWRGLVAGVIERAVQEIGDVRAAWVGPCIHACCYEVGPEVISAFEEAGLPVADDRHVDPRDAATAILQRAGVDALAASEDCTSCTPRYFSYRRDGVTGRQGALITLTA